MTQNWHYVHNSTTRGDIRINGKRLCTACNEWLGLPQTQVLIGDALQATRWFGHKIEPGDVALLMRSLQRVGLAVVSIEEARDAKVGKVGKELDETERVVRVITQFRASGAVGMYLDLKMHLDSEDVEAATKHGVVECDVDSKWGNQEAWKLTAKGREMVRRQEMVEGAAS